AILVGWSVTSTTVRHCRQCRQKDRGAQLMLGDWAAAMSSARFAVEERESRDAETGWLSGRYDVWKGGLSG
ncbi:hypothetical protein, partial [Pseudomonas aeruginosa]|uniref:hypothetical protein n=1 Tax=Pseudomonas aeruginosa TaxID=287 RepID=UPI0031B6A115